jgi:hypothetical protein
MDEQAAEIRARLASLSNAALRRVLRVTAEQGRTRAAELVAAELERRGVSSNKATRRALAAAKPCRDYWHTVTSFRTARCPSCGLVTGEVWPRSPETRARRRQGPAEPTPEPKAGRPIWSRDDDDDESLLELLARAVKEWTDD